MPAKGKRTLKYLGIQIQGIATISRAKTETNMEKTPSQGWCLVFIEEIMVMASGWLTSHWDIASWNSERNCL